MSRRKILSCRDEFLDELKYLEKQPNQSHFVFSLIREYRLKDTQGLTKEEIIRLIKKYAGQGIANEEIADKDPDVMNSIKSLMDITEMQ